MSRIALYRSGPPGRSSAPSSAPSPATVAALKALVLTDVAVASTVYLRGRLTTGDGGQGWFKVLAGTAVANSLVADDGYVVQNTAATLTFVRIDAGPIRVRAYGTTAAAWQAALDYATGLYASTEAIQRVTGEGYAYALAIGASAVYQLRRSVSGLYDVFRAVRIRSGVVVEDAIFTATNVEAVADSTEYAGWFATDRHDGDPLLGTVDWGFRRCRFNTGASERSLNMPILPVGGARGHMIDCSGGGDDDVTGASICKLWNIAGMTVSGNRFSYVNQMLGARYSPGIYCVGNIVEYYRTEAVDLNGRCPNFHIDDNDFGPSSQAGEQAIDASGSSNGTINNNRLHNTGGGIAVHTDGGAYPTFAAFMADPNGAAAPAAADVPAVTDVQIVGNVATGGDMTTAGTAILWIEPNARIVGAPLMQRITVRDFKAVATGPVRIYEGKDFLIDGVHLEDTITGTDAIAGYAFMAIAAGASGTALAETELSGVMRNITVRDSQGGGALFVPGSHLVVETVKIDGYNLQGHANTKYGIRFVYLGRKAGRLEFAGLDVSNGDTSPQAPTDLLIDTVATAAFTLVNGGGHRFATAGGTPIAVLLGSLSLIHMLPQRVIPLGNVSTMGGDVTLGLDGPGFGGEFWFAAYLQNGPVITGDAANGATVHVRQLSGGGSTSIASIANYGLTSIATGVATTFGFAAGEVAANFGVNLTPEVFFDQVAAGKVFERLAVLAEVISYETV